MRDAFINSLADIAKDDPKTILITGDLGFGVFDEFRNKFPGQFLNAGISEQNMTSIACSMALDGFKVYTYSIGNFPTLRCLEQIRNNICYHNANVTVVSIGAGFSYGQLGMSHFATEDVAIMRALPNITIANPSSDKETYEITKILHQEINSPKFLRLDKSSASIFSKFDEDFFKPKLHSAGSDIALISSGGLLDEIVKASKIIEEEGYSVSIISIPFLKPFNENSLIKILNSHELISVFEEHNSGGLAGVILEAMGKLSMFPKKFIHRSIPDEYPSIVGDQMYLREHYSLTSDKIAEFCLLSFRK
tara:strand:- start:3576 stop:4493 length:918 start_codon:yes stop_codon:yes gene_type:complete